MMLIAFDVRGHRGHSESLWCPHQPYTIKTARGVYTSTIDTEAGLPSVSMSTVAVKEAAAFEAHVHHGCRRPSVFMLGACWLSTSPVESEGDL